MYDDLKEKLSRLEYHQSLLLKMIAHSDDHFYKLVIKNALTKQDVEQFYKQCQALTMALEDQKAEGFVYFQPLFEQFKGALHPNLTVEEVVPACIQQGLFLPLMLEFKKYIV